MQFSVYAVKLESVRCFAVGHLFIVPIKVYDRYLMQASAVPGQLNSGTLQIPEDY